MSPQKWRTSYDTKEIDQLLKPQQAHNQAAMPYLSPKERFTTTKFTDQKNTSTYIDKTKTFGPD